jgi:DNA-binding response OmpR family regulator
VDDDPDTVVSLLAILRDEGYDAKGVADARRAVAEVEAFDPDVLIVDIAMPNVSGWDIARELRNKPGKKPVLIAISGVSAKSTAQMRSRAAGFKFFLQKPCEPSFLLNILSAVPSGN